MRFYGFAVALGAMTLGACAGGEVHWRRCGKKNAGSVDRGGGVCEDLHPDRIGGFASNGGCRIGSAEQFDCVGWARADGEDVRH